MSKNDSLRRSYQYWMSKKESAENWFDRPYVIIRALGKSYTLYQDCLGFCFHEDEPRWYDGRGGSFIFIGVELENAADTLARNIISDTGLVGDTERLVKHLADEIKEDWNYKNDTMLAVHGNCEKAIEALLKAETGTRVAKRKRNRKEDKSQA